MLNAKIGRLTSKVNFVEKNQIITSSCIQIFSTGVTMNEHSTNSCPNKAQPKSMICYFFIYTWVNKETNNDHNS